MTCIYGCQKDGTPCPRPHTCHTIGLIKKQQDECCTGNCRQGRDCTRASYGIFDVVKDVVLVLVAIVVVVAAADYIANNWHGVTNFFRG